MTSSLVSQPSTRTVSLSGSYASELQILGSTSAGFCGFFVSGHPLLNKLPDYHWHQCKHLGISPDMVPKAESLNSTLSEEADPEVKL